MMALPGESQGLFEKAKIPLIYCGIGKINASLAATELILRDRPDHILNLGTAGSHVFSTHQLIECSSLVQRDMDLSPLGFPRGQTPLDPFPGKLELARVLEMLPHGCCGTGDRFEVGPPELACDLVDMEAYAIAKVCKKLKVGFTALKYITDGSDDKAHHDWKENLKPASARLLQAYHEFIEVYRP
jgi:adenosylhomocysteine nucleosidase